MQGWYPKGPCAQIVDTLAPKYVYRDYLKAKVPIVSIVVPFWGYLLGSLIQNWLNQKTEIQLIYYLGTWTHRDMNRTPSNAEGGSVVGFRV